MPMEILPRWFIQAAIALTLSFRPLLNIWRPGGGGYADWFNSAIACAMDRLDE